MLFVDQFDRNKRLEDQLSEHVKFPVVFDRRTGIIVDRLKGASFSGYVMALDDAFSQLSVLQAAYAIAIRKDGYLSGYEIWKTFHPPEAGHYIVREELVLVRKAIAKLTDEEIIKTRRAAHHDLELKTRGSYIGQLRNLRRENDISWNGFRLNSKTHYFELPTGKGFDNLTHDEFKIIESLFGESNVASELLAKRVFNYRQNEQDWRNFRQTMYQLRKKIGHEFLTTISQGVNNKEYSLQNLTQSHPQTAYASPSLKAPARSA